MFPAVLIAALVLALAVLLLFRGSGLGPTATRPRGEGGKDAAARSGADPRSCPLCGELLRAGERVKSDLFPGPGDRIMHIHGCPRCWPAVAGARPRRCPVCGGELRENERVYARYFERPGRHHVHVLGCDGCRKGGR